MDRIITMSRFEEPADNYDYVIDEEYTEPTLKCDFCGDKISYKAYYWLIDKQGNVEGFSVNFNKENLPLEELECCCEECLKNSMMDSAHKNW